jgi:O-antigen ligase
MFAVAGLFSLRAPVFAASAFLWNNIFQPLSFARSPGAFPAAQAVLALLVGSYALHMVRGTLKPKGNFLIWYSPILLGWILITALISPIPHAMEGFVEILKYLVPLFFISLGLRSVLDIKILSILLTLSVGVWSAQAGIHGMVKGVTRDMAIQGGQMTDNNDFMAATVSILPMLLFLTFSYKGKFKIGVKSGGFLIAILSIAAIIFSGSRGATLGLVASALLYVVLVSKKKMRDGVGLVVVAVAVLLVLPDAFWERMSTIRIGAEQTEGSAQERMHMMTAAFWAVVDKPLFGVGPDCWLAVSEYYSGLRFDPHNIWLKLTAEIGIPGLILYLIALGGTIGQLFRARKLALRRRDSECANLATALIMVIIGFLMPSTFLSHPFAEWLWAWLCIANAFVVIYKEKVIRDSQLFARAARAKMASSKIIGPLPPRPASDLGLG